MKISKEQMLEGLDIYCTFHFCDKCKLDKHNRIHKCNFIDYTEEELIDATNLINNTTTVEIPKSYSQETVESMAYEIARYRYPNQYYYDDKQINEIINEFS